MDGVYINLSDCDYIINIGEKHIVVAANTDLVTPIRKMIKTNGQLSGIISSALKDEDVHTIQSTQMFNTVYNKITRTEQNAPMINMELICPYHKYPFTKEQVDKINIISSGRTRLFIMTKEDAEFWSSGNFDCPFRNYRIFTPNKGGLVEYPIPKTYLDIISGSLGNVTRKFSMW